MARTFDGVDDTIRLAGASLTGIDLGGRTAIMLLKRGSNGAYAALFVAWQDAGVTDAWAMEIDTANQLEFYQVVGGSPVNSGALTVTVSDGWTLVGMNKTTGSTTPRFHKFVMSTGTATHANASGVQGNTRQIGASGYLEIGTYGAGVDPMNGEIAFAAILDHQVTDAEFEGLATSLQSWLTSGAVGLWAFDQAATSTLVRDMVGTAHQTAIVGTAAGTTSPPMGYGHQVIIPTGVAAGGGGSPQTITAQIGTMTLTGVAGTVTVGAATKTAQVGTMALTGVQGAVTAGGVTITAQIATMTLTGVQGTVAIGALTQTAQVGTMTLTGVAGVVTAGPVTITAQPATLVLSGVQGSVSIAGGSGQTITAQPAVMTLTGVQGTVTGGPATITAQPAVLALVGVQGVITAGPVTKVAQVGVMTLTGVSVTPTAGAFTVAAQVATLALTGVQGALSAGATTKVAQVGLLTLTGVQGLVYIGGLSPTITGLLTTSSDSTSVLTTVDSTVGLTTVSADGALTTLETI